MLGKESVRPAFSVPSASFHPLFDRQHALRPNQPFDPGPPALNLSDLFSPFGHCGRRNLSPFVLHASTFWRPLAPRPLQPVPRYYGRSDSCRALTARQVSQDSRARPSRPFRLQPPDAPPAPLSHAIHQRAGLRHFLAGSPIAPGRIEFVILRTGHSPPVAPRPASRRRSYSRLQAGERLPEKDFHLSDRTRSQAHQPGS